MRILADTTHATAPCSRRANPHIDNKHEKMQSMNLGMPFERDGRRKEQLSHLIFPTHILMVWSGCHLETLFLANTSATSDMNVMHDEKYIWSTNRCSTRCSARGATSNNCWRHWFAVSRIISLPNIWYKLCSAASSLARHLCTASAQFGTRGPATRSCYVFPLA